MADQSFFSKMAQMLKQYGHDAMPGGSLNPEVSSENIRMAAELASMSPNQIGDVASLGLAVDDLRKGDYGSAAMNGVGILPFVPALGVIKQAGNLGKYGRLPDAIKTIPGPLPKAIDMTNLKGVSNVDVYGSVWPKNAEGMLRIRPMEGGGFVMTGGGMSHISKVKPFYAVGDSAEELAQHGINRLENSTRSIQGARAAKVPKQLRDQLESEFGKVFDYDISNAARSNSQYITHRPTGTKIRISDHDLPGYYENTASIDIRPEEVGNLVSMLRDYIK